MRYAVTTKEEEGIEQGLIVPCPKIIIKKGQQKKQGRGKESNVHPLLQKTQYEYPHSPQLLNFDSPSSLSPSPFDPLLAATAA